MIYPKKVSLSDFFHEVYTASEEYLGSVYNNTSVRKWAIKEYPGQWFESEQNARSWLIMRNQPTAKG